MDGGCTRGPRLVIKEATPRFGRPPMKEGTTASRDYIYVTDLADAHVRALRYLETGGSSGVSNCRGRYHET